MVMGSVVNEFITLAGASRNMREEAPTEVRVKGTV